MEELEFYLEEAQDHMEKSLSHVSHALAKIRAGRAMPSMLDGLMVEYYGNPTPINQVASVNTPDAKTLAIKPWEKNILSEIEKVIINSDLGLNPQNDGEIIRLNIPPLTEERRKDLVKQAKNEAENSKISIRNSRRAANDLAKSMEKDGMPEDESKKLQDKIQELTDEHIKKVDDLLGKKETDIMTV